MIFCNRDPAAGSPGADLRLLLDCKHVVTAGNLERSIGLLFKFNAVAKVIRCVRLRPRFHAGTYRRAAGLPCRLSHAMTNASFRGHEELARRGFRFIHKGPL